MTLSDRLALKQRDDGEQEQVYIPYILDMIAYLVKHRIEFDDSISLSEINSSLLNVEITDDFVVNGMCDREIAKLENLSIDQQIIFFVNLAVRYNGCISIYDVKSLLIEINIHQIDDNTIEKLKGHPILSYYKNQLSFRYDFFNGYFKGLYIGIFFNEKDIKQLDNYFIETIGSYIKFDDSFTKNICLRIDLNDELTLFAIEIIESLQIMRREKNQSDIYNIRKAISSIFVMLLTLLRESKKTFNVETCTELLKEIFMDANNNTISGLSLINLFGYNKTKPIFDFKGLNFNDCYFEMYEYFWECPIDESTKFSKSCFKSLKLKSGIKPKFFINTFHSSCDIKEIEEIISTREEEKDNKKNDIRTNLIKFFKIFYTRGNFYPKKQEQIKSKGFTNKYLPTLLRNKVILEYTDPTKATLKQYKVSEKYQSITKIIEQRGSCIELDSVVNMFIK